MDANRRKINIRQLRQIIDQILLHVEEELEIAEVELVENYYWDVPDEVVYSLDKQPADLNVGSLYDDLDFLLPILSNKDQAFPLMLVHAAPLLKHLALKLAK